MDDLRQRRGPGWGDIFINIVVGGTVLFFLAFLGYIGFLAWALSNWDKGDDGSAPSPQPPDTSEHEPVDPGPPWGELAAEPVFDLDVPDADAGETTGETGTEHLLRDRSAHSHAERVWQVNAPPGDEAYIDVVDRLRDHGASVNGMVCDEASLRASGTLPVDLPTRPRAGAVVQWATFSLAHEPEPGRITLQLAASYRRPPYPEVYGEDADRRSFGDECPTDVVQAAGLHDAPRSPAERREDIRE